ncbi:MAG TPA: patatin-like phospholipase family protein [Bacteroidota bacterium]|nr:patatin-like phospholipase family protein [Bacteroidota bacterium]
MARRWPFTLKIFALFAVLIAFPQLPHAQPQAIVYPTKPELEFQGLSLRPRYPLGRPKIGLVLSGGGARGLAQIGVLKMLERNHIPIDLIVGNSLGSVIGGMYASGYSTSEIESIATSTNWGELLSFSEDTKRTDLFVGQKETQAEGYLVMRFDGLQPIIPSSISGGQRFSDFFTSITLKALYHPRPTFDDLKIPFRAIATDLIHGNRLILDRGSLAEAMRASVTVPLLYSPLFRDSTLLVDGGLTRNIPVDVAKILGCDVVIVVNSTSPLRTADQMNAPWEIADQIMTIMMQEENKRQLSMADMVFTPDIGNRIVSDFSDIQSIIRAGEVEAENNMSKLESVLKNTTGSDSTRNAVVIPRPHITFSGDLLPAGLSADVRRRLERENVTIEDIRSVLDEIAAGKEFDQLYADIVMRGSPSRIEVHAVRKPLLKYLNIIGDGKTLISEPVLRRELDTLMGKPIENGAMQNALQHLLADCRERGYSLATIDSVSFDRKDGGLTIEIHQGKIAQIRYEGNTRTRDYILRRELPFTEGDVFNAARAYQGIVNIKSMGLFEYVLLEVQYHDGQPILIVKVKEKSSELLRLGIHADDEHELVTTIDARDIDFRGAWEDLGLRLRYGFRDRSAQIDYTINRIFNSYFTFGMKGFFNSRDVITYRDDPSLSPGRWDRIEEGRYKENKYGWLLSFGRHVERFGDITAQLRIENHKIAAISGQGYIPERYNFVGIKLQSTIDTKDQFWFPREGMYLSLSYESATKNLGSEVGFGKVMFSYESYLTIAPSHTLRPKLTFGFADATLPIAEQFSLGGFHSFYGLREDDSRGRQLFVTSMEYRYELPFRLIFPTYVMGRYDLGMISLLPEELKLNSFRHGIGFEIALETPLGAAMFGAGKSFYFRRDLPDSPVSVGPLLFYFSVGAAL